jgi:transposase
MVELAWMWLRWQADGALPVWFRAGVEAMGGQKLPVALWRYVTDGIIANGATLKAA